MIIVLLITFVLLVVTMRVRRKRARAMTADAMTDVLGTVGTYRGRRWKVGDPWV